MCRGKRELSFFDGWRGVLRRATRKLAQFTRAIGQVASSGTRTGNPCLMGK